MAWGKKKDIPITPPESQPVVASIPAEPETQSVDIYVANGICDNCEVINRFSIPKGMKVKAAIEKMTCGNCGIPGEIRQIFAEELIKLSTNA